MDRGEYERAAALLRDVVGTSPGSLEGHYRLAVSASHLGLVAEAIHEFEWVVANAPADVPETQIARDWLAALSAKASGPPEPTAPTNPDHASLSGVALAGEDSLTPLVRHRLSLKGMKEPVIETAYDVRTDQAGRFDFPDVVPGEYMLTDAVGGPPIWRLRLTFKPGDRVTLNLTPENSTRTRDDFPDRR